MERAEEGVSGMEKAHNSFTRGLDGMGVRRCMREP